MIGVYDRERIAKIMADIEGYLRDCDALGIGGPADLADKRNYYALSMILFAIFNRIIDLGDEIVIGKKLGVPSTYRDIFRLLWKGGVIDCEMARELSRLVFYRNKLSHQYSDVSEQDLMDILARTGVMLDFIEKMKAVVNRDN